MPKNPLRTTAGIPSDPRLYFHHNRVLAEQTLRSLPEGEWKKYQPRFQELNCDLQAGSFVGLVCKTCLRWLEHGHTPECRNQLVDDETRHAHLEQMRVCREQQLRTDGTVAGRGFGY